MPGIHRHGDSRFCGATTVATGQSTVRVGGKLVAVEGDQSTHVGGALISVYGSTVKIGGKKVIVAVGDKAGPDSKKHPAPPTDPKGASATVIVYGGKAGGG